MALTAESPDDRMAGRLQVDGVDCAELARLYGTPLYVISERTLRENARRFKAAFEGAYGSVEVLYATKALSHPAVRLVLKEEGIGGDCTSLAELKMSLEAGVRAERLVLNGSQKGAAELDLAIRHGVTIILDEPGDMARVRAAMGAEDRRVRLGIRAKLTLGALPAEHVGSSHFGPGGLSQQSLDNKWGMSLDEAIACARRIHDDPLLELHELHYHLGRVTTDPKAFAAMAAELATWSLSMERATGLRVPALNLGGGWAVGRKEGLGPGGVDDERTPTFEAYAEAVTAAITAVYRSAGADLPELRLEPGRALVATAVLLLTRVSHVKSADYGKRWVNVDASTNHLPRVRTSDWYHHMVVANRDPRPVGLTADVVGPTCVLDVIARDRDLGDVEAGDLIAILDTGAYGESAASSFNGLPRPATVMVSDAVPYLVTRRETLEDLAARFHVPSHLQGDRQTSGQGEAGTSG